MRTRHSAGAPGDQQLRQRPEAEPQTPPPEARAGAPLRTSSRESANARFADEVGPPAPALSPSRQLQQHGRHLF